MWYLIFLLFSIFQFLLGKEYAVIFPEVSSAEVWPLHLCSVVTDSQHSV